MSFNNQASPPQNQTKLVSRILLKLDGSPGFRPKVSVTIFVIGLLLWLSVQGFLIVGPLWSRALPPEVDDSLSYVLKSRQMTECLNQECPALKDLRWELSSRFPDPPSYPHRRLAASRIYPVYHPLFSMILVSLNKFGLDWMTSYKAIWTVAPLIFVLAFSYILIVLWGLPAAGLALGLLAFKVFPDTGLNCIVPSNLTMAVATGVWARIISQRGYAPWTMAIGSLFMLAMHPIGIVYSLMAALISVVISGSFTKIKTWFPAFFTLSLLALALLIPTLVNGPQIASLSITPDNENFLEAIAFGAVNNLKEVLANIVRLGSGLFGSLPVFFGAVMLGLFSSGHERRNLTTKIIFIYIISIIASLLYTYTHPADLTFRIWIPFVVILFGAVGQSIKYSVEQTWNFWMNCIVDPVNRSISVGPRRLWPVITLAVLIGYSLHMSALGGEQVYATAQHMCKRQPLLFDRSQTKLLLSKAKPGDRVLYTSSIIMPYYFIQGAMDLGAVYYHPLMEGKAPTRRLLKKPNLRFAVTYNPTVYHPSFEGRLENEWWTQAPEFYFSPLNQRREYGPISREGWIPSSNFLWIEVFPKSGNFLKNLQIDLKNPGEWCEIAISDAGKGQRDMSKAVIKKAIPAGWSGQLEVDLAKLFGARGYRISLPKGEAAFFIHGVTFGNTQLNWPWDQKAELCFMAKDLQTGRVCVSFNPEEILPAPLNHKDIIVLDDKGSSVLYEIR